MIVTNQDSNHHQTGNKLLPNGNNYIITALCDSFGDKIITKNGSAKAAHRPVMILS